MELTLSSVTIDLVSRTLESLGNAARATPLWRVDCGHAVRALVGGHSASVVVTTPASRTIGELARIAAGATPVTRRRASGVWARAPIGPDAAANVIGVNARPTESDTVVSLVCHLEAPLPREEMEQRLGLLRVVFPVFSAAVAQRFGRRTEDIAEHPLLSASVRQLLDALPDGVACLDDDGRMIWRNRVLARTFAGAEEADRLRRELAATVPGLAIRAWGRRNGHDEDDVPEIVGGEFHTRRGRFWLRLLRAEDVGDSLVVAIVTRLGLPPTDDTFASIRARYHLTLRESQVGQLLLDGHSNAEVADALDISPHTARHHTERLLRKLGLKSRGEIFYLVAAHRSGEMRIPTRR